MCYDENIKYNEDIILDIKDSVSLLGVVNSYFEGIEGEFREGKGDIQVKIYPKGKFFYNYCPNHWNGIHYSSFYVDEEVQLFHCFGCGWSGNVIDFLSEVFNLTINEAVELACAIGGLFNVNILSENLLKIYTLIMFNYDKKDNLIEESQRKLDYLTCRVKNYLENYYFVKVKNDLKSEDFKRIANRLCCDPSFVSDVYYTTDCYSKIRDEKNKLRLLRESKIEFY